MTPAHQLLLRPVHSGGFRDRPMTQPGVISLSPGRSLVTEKIRFLSGGAGSMWALVISGGGSACLRGKPVKR